MGQSFQEKSVAAERLTTYLLLRCSASSGCGGRIGSSHLLCELRVMLVNRLARYASSGHSILLRCRRLGESFFVDICLEYDVDRGA